MPTDTEPEVLAAEVVSKSEPWPEARELEDDAPETERSPSSSEAEPDAFELALAVGASLARAWALDFIKPGSP
jgi:hypothetical protein